MARRAIFIFLRIISNRVKNLAPRPRGRAQKERTHCRQLTRKP